jgi:shikimate dehydrogenase
VTTVFAVLGWPIAHSRSPAMHNAAFAAAGLDAVYVPLAVPEARLPAAVAALRALGVSGCNVTLPHKHAIMALLDEVDATARAIGAVNTVWRQDDQLLGTNTDGAGLCASLREGGVALPGSRVVITGTGGAARAAVVGLAQAGAERAVIAGRRPEQARALAEELRAACPTTQLSSCDLGAGLSRALADATLLVQATSATLDSSPAAEAFADALPLAALPADAVVCDLVYKPRQTAVLRRAAARGLRTVDGLGMLLHQGALAFTRFTGLHAPLEAMRGALTKSAAEGS